jgi:hypothetical protein
MKNALAGDGQVVRDDPAVSTPPHCPGYQDQFYLGAPRTFEVSASLKW